MRTRRDPRRRTSQRFIFGLILIPTLVLFSASALLVGRAAHRARAQVTEQYALRIAAVADEVDGMLNEVIQTEALLQTSRDLIDFFVASDVFPLPQQYRPIEAGQAISRFQESKAIIASAAILQTGWNRVLTGGGLTTFPLHLEENHYDAYDTAFWRNELENGGPAIEILAPTVREFTTGNRRMVLPMVMRRVGDFWSHNLFVIDLDSAWISRYLASRTETPNSAIYVYDTHGELLMRGGARSPQPLAYDEIPETSRRGNLVFRYTSSSRSVSPLEYVAVVPRRDILTIARADLWFGLAIVGAGAIFATLFAYGVSRRIYSPLRKLGQMLNATETPPASLSSEYESIRQKIVTLLDRKREVELELQSTIPVVFEVYLIRLLNLGIDPTTHHLRRLISRHDLQFRFRHFIVVVVQVSFHGDTYPAVASRWMSAADLVSDGPVSGPILGIQRLISRSLERLCRNHNLVLDRNRIAVIANFSEPDSCDSIVERMRDIANLFSDDAGVESFIGGAGMRQEELDGLCQSYRQALSALATADPFEVGITRYDPDHESRRAFIYTIEDETLIYNHLNSGDLAAVHTRLQEIVERNLRLGAGAEAIRELHAQLYYTGLRVVYSRNERPETIMGESYVPVERFLRGDLDGPEMVEYIRRFYGKIAATSEAPSASKIDLSDLLEYVHEHFREAIYLETLAERFDTTDKYISRVFKKRTSVSFYEYLTSLRINTARELLTGSDLKIADVYEHCGFANRSTFVRAFRGQTGMTPSQYRNRAQAVERRA